MPRGEDKTVHACAAWESGESVLDCCGNKASRKSGRFRIAVSPDGEAPSVCSIVYETRPAATAGVV